MRTTDHTWINLGQENIIAHLLRDLSRFFRQISNRSTTSVTNTVTAIIPVESPMTKEIIAGNPSSFFWGRGYHFWEV